MMRVNLSTTSFKNKLSVMLVGMTCVSIILSGCGQRATVKKIEKDASATQEIAGTSNQEADKNENNKEVQVDAQNTASDMYSITLNGVSVTVDAPADEVISQMGKENTYFEAASCAFEGLDKYYSYDHFEIDTYPDGDKDYISAVVLLDDLISTDEGVSLGMTKDDVIAVYGEDYETNGSSYVYTKGSGHLTFVFKGNDIISISYDTSKLDGAGQ